MNAKKHAVLIIRRHAGEIDWILPLIYKFNKDIELITIFNDKNSYQSLVNNSTLFRLWKKKCNKFYIIKKTDRILYKLLYKILYLLKINKLFNISKIEFFLIRSLFNFKKFEKQFKIKRNKINIILTAVNNLSSIPHIIKFHSTNSKLIRYPESTAVYPSAKENKYFYIGKDYRNYYDEFTDFYLLNKNNINHYFGLNINKKIKKKIIICKILRYEKWWLKNLFTNKIKENGNFNIGVITRAPDQDPLNILDYTKIILTIMDIANTISGSKVIFKIHPSLLELKLLKKILINFNKKKWKIYNDHTVNLARNTNICISIINSAALDVLAVNKNVIEFYNINKKNRFGNGYLIYNKNKKKWVSFFQYKKLAYNVQNKQELLLIIKKIKLKNLSMFKNNLLKKIMSIGLNTNSINKKIFNS